MQQAGARHWEEAPPYYIALYYGIQETNNELLLLPLIPLACIEDREDEGLGGSAGAEKAAQVCVTRLGRFPWRGAQPSTGLHRSMAGPLKPYPRCGQLQTGMPDIKNPFHGDWGLDAVLRGTWTHSPLRDMDPRQP